jgi:carotenoid cleavage dioxygenase-like enzyme
MHSFAMSAAYIVLTETPVYIDVLRLLAAPVTGTLR